ncbi:hypothetical protein ACT2FY_39435 [Paraburkholderia fungorum]|uniref:hypothetical protein n=1 Tax=Paraburkholderia fungorum TaxID=134537 RepID=UPI00402BD486
MIDYGVSIRLLVIAVTAATLALASYRLGASRVQAKWDAEKSHTAIATAKTEAAQANVTARVVTQYVDRVKTVRERGQTIVNEVPIYVPSDSACDLPAGFRLLHDAAAAGELPAPAGTADAASVSAQTVAATVAENYATHHATAEQLEALQRWVREQAVVSSTQRGAD